MVAEKKLNELMNDKQFCEALGVTIYNELVSDDEPSYRMGRYLIKAFIDGNVDDALIALCGWSLETLFDKAAARVGQDAESEDEEEPACGDEPWDVAIPIPSTDDVNDYIMSKKGNMAYWDEIDTMAEDYVRALMGHSITPIKNADDYDTILVISKDITERTVKLLTESYGATYPYVDENY